MNAVQRTFNRVVDFVVGPLIEARVTERMAGLRGESWEDEPAGYRRITAGLRDVKPTEHRQMLIAADKVATENPLGKRIVDLILEFTAGDGLEIQCKNQQLRKVVQEHWEDEDLAWERNLERYYSDIIIDGELFLRAFVNAMDGSVRWAPIYNRNISERIADSNDPDRLLMIDVVGMGPLRIIRRVEDPNSDKFGLLDGDVLWFSINRRTNSLYGKSDLLHLLDWLDAFDQVFWGEIERMYVSRLHVVDVQVNGGKKPDLRRRYNELKQRGLRPGEFFVHNENETMTIKTAEGAGSQEGVGFSRFLRDHLVGAAGFPSIYFGDLHGGTRASATETSEPVHRRLKKPQRWLRWFVADVLSFVRDQYIAHRPERRSQFPLKSRRNWKVTVTLPDPARQVQLLVAKSFASIVQPLIQAVEQNLISKEEAREIIGRALLQHLGLDFDPKKALPTPAPAPPDKDDDEDPPMPPEATGSIGGSSK